VLQGCIKTDALAERRLQADIMDAKLECAGIRINIFNTGII
jgi:hypothetical protein